MNVVQNGGADLNMAVTSREEILAVCREIVAEEGLSSHSHSHNIQKLDFIKCFV